MWNEPCPFSDKFPFPDIYDYCVPAVAGKEIKVSDLLVGTNESIAELNNIIKSTRVKVGIKSAATRVQQYAYRTVKNEYSHIKLTDASFDKVYTMERKVAEMKEKLSMAHCLDYALYTHGMSMSYQGSLESTWNGFYMSSVSGVDTSYLEVPAVLQEALEMNGFYPDPFVYEEGTLCEFDVTWGSGWMYVVNNSFPNIPFCDYVPQDGDVMRVQFTLAYGADIGDWGMMGEPYFETVDRDELTALIADAIEAGVDYSNAFEVVSTFGVTQEELNAAVEELKEQLS
jgi:hypothetical protein